jgi:NarL family two-component system response regulator LiaR
VPGTDPTAAGEPVSYLPVRRHDDAGYGGAAAKRAGQPELAARPRVLIIDDDPLAAGALRGMLEEAGGAVIAEAPVGDAAIVLAGRQAPDIAFVNLPTPVPDGLSLVRDLAALELAIRPIVLSADRDPDAVLAAIRAGARGILSKSDLLAYDLARLLRAAMGGELICSRSMATAMVDRLAHSPVLGVGFRPVRSRLTPREWEVLDMLCDRRTNDQVADEFVISIETVRTHVKNVMRKLGVSSRGDVVAAAAGLRGQRSPMPGGNPLGVAGATLHDFHPDRRAADC